MPVQMIMKEPLFLFAFANDKNQSLRLKEEERLIREILAPAHDQNQIEYFSLGSTSVDDIYQTFNRFHDRICIFQYSGHSNDTFLLLEDTSARAASLSVLIGMQKNLKLVVLNGCSNHNQVSILFTKGVKVVIATSVPIDDHKAVQFSKFFYQALVNGKTIREAFDTAVSRVQNEAPELQAFRGIYNRSKDIQESVWGLYGIKEEYLDWVLPDLERKNEAGNFSQEVEIVDRNINKKLVDLTFEGMSQYGEPFKAMWQLYQQNSSPALFNTLQNMMLDSLPSSLSIQLRDLFTPNGRSKGRLRLDEIHEGYLTLVKLLAAISLANLWKVVLDNDTLKPKKDLFIRPEYRKELRQYYHMTPKVSEQFDYLWFVTTISRIFQENRIDPFLEESKNLHHNLINYDESYQAYRFLEQNLRSRISAKNIDVTEVEELCHKSEHALGVLLKQCGFLSIYQLVTIKQIEIHKPNRVKQAEYVHYKAVLRGRDYATIDDAPVFRSTFTSNNSVLITKDISGQSDQLNLSPFVIDENAFKIKEEKLPKIYFFNGWLNEMNLYYQHAEMLEENFRVKEAFDIKKYKKSLLDLKKQFLWFRQDLEL